MTMQSYKKKTEHIKIFYDYLTGKRLVRVVTVIIDSNFQPYYLF